jgi:hypothetical protein
VASSTSITFDSRRCVSKWDLALQGREQGWAVHASSVDASVHALLGNIATRQRRYAAAAEGYPKLTRCPSLSLGADLIDEGFLLVGFRKPSLYRPHPDKKLCVHIGWLVATALTDAIRGTAKMVYPYEEFVAIRELGDRVANQMPNYQIANPILMLGLFEVRCDGSLCERCWHLSNRYDRLFG